MHGAALTSPERSPTGVPGLDEVMHGGFVAGRLYLVDGHPGSGKTTLGLQYLLEGLRAGERCVYVTLSETGDELRAGARSHDWTLEGIEIVELASEEEPLRPEEQLTMFYPSEVELTQTTRRMLERVEQIRPQRLVIDSLSELRLLAQNSLRYRRQVLALKQFFAGRQCTVLLLDDRTSEGPDLQLQSIAHGVISLEHKAPAYGHALRQLRVAKFRGSDFSGGYQDILIRRGGMQVFPRLTSQHRAVATRSESVASGVNALDHLLGGGIDRGTATLMVGPPGTGKSTVALRYAVAAAARGDHAAIFAFEESREIMLERAASLGLPLPRGSGPGEVLIRQIDPAEISPGEFAHVVRQSVERDGARVVVIDSLNGYLNAMPEDRFLTAQLHALLAYLNSRSVATFLVAAQSGAFAGSLHSPIDASYLADTVVILRMFEHSGRVKKAISVLKKRSGWHETSIRELWFDADGVHVGEPLTQFRGILTGLPVELDGDGGDAR